MDDRLEKRIEELAPRERANLEFLRQQLKGNRLTPQNLSRLLPEAISLAEDEKHALSRAAMKTTENAIDLSVREEPEILSSAIYPIIGPAIRKALNKALADMVSGMNSGLESVFSFQQLAWRIKAWRAGVSYFEIALQHMIEFSVEQVFLIHGKTGLLLHSLSRSGSHTADDDMVASMLTVIQQYIKDSLFLDKKESVHDISVGEYSILVENGPRAIIALIVRGVPDQSLRPLMQQSLENVHSKLSGPLTSFSGDTIPFQNGADLLMPCLVSRQKTKRSKPPIFAIAALSLLALTLGYFAYTRVAQHKEFTAFLDALNAEPGIILISHTGHFRGDEIRILRDDRAKGIEAIVENFELNRDELIIMSESYYSAEFGLPGSGRIPEELREIARHLGEYTLFFEEDSGDLRLGQETAVIEAGTLVSTLVSKAKAYGITATVEIIGHSAGNIQDESSISVSEERSRKALERFLELNANLSEYVRSRGVGVNDPVVTPEVTEEDRVKNRSVTFEAIFE